MLALGWNDVAFSGSSRFAADAQHEVPVGRRQQQREPVAAGELR